MLASSSSRPGGGSRKRPADAITPDDNGAASPSRPCLLTDLPVELVHSICLSKTMCSPEGGVSLSLLSRTCTVFGKADKKGGTALVSQWTQQYCKEAGVRRLPLTMGDGWCWSRMLSWLSQAVRVGAQCELKTIKAGVEAARGKQEEIKGDGGDLVEGSVLVLVEPGVYEEQRVRVVDGQRVSIWRCDRGGESNKEEMQKVEWQSIDAGTLSVYGHASVSVSGMHMAAMKSKSGYDSVGCGFNCVCASAGGTLSLELCDLTCEDAAIAGFVGITSSAVVVRCRIHNGNEGGVLICGGASATLENNTITVNDLAGVDIYHQATATLVGNTIKGNGQCKIERTEEVLVEWTEEDVALYRSPNGFPGVRVVGHSTITMPPGSNAVEGNGKVGSDGEQVMVDETSNVN